MMQQNIFRTAALALAILVVLAVPALAQAGGRTINVAVSSAKVERGGTVEITIDGSGREDIHAVLLRPSKGTETLALRKTGGADSVYRAAVEIDPSSSPGLYAVHAWTGDRSNPSSVGKGSFRVENMVADYFVANYLDKEKPEEDLSKYLAEFRAVGGNFLVAHNLIIPSGAFYPSKITKTASTFDMVELLLDRADREGIGVLLSVSWDNTRDAPYKGRMKEIKAIAAELYGRYRHHPSLAGFYSWQEGSGTYYAPFIREFSEYIKSLNPGLLTACAPHIDDPLLASYLSVIEELDIMIYQSAVMASYRPDNRKEYPLRRVRDFSGLGAGAKRLQNKITLTHVELFAYMEKRLKPEILTASYEDIYGQILSAATVTDTDGIALFTYQAHIYDQAKKNEYAKQGRAAVTDGLKKYQEITSRISGRRNPLALYIPYSDFVIERWNNYFLPALDAFRVLGVPVDILPYAPAMAESVYPYYPIHMNEDVLERLLKERTVLVLANVSGFQQTDSDLIKAFVERGGIVVAFGEQVPFGRTFERDQLFGGTALPGKIHTRIISRFPRGIPSDDGRVSFAATELPSWKPGSAAVLAEYEDGTAAVLVNKAGEGSVFTILPSAEFAAVNFPSLVRSVLNLALRASSNESLVEIAGADSNMDFAVDNSPKGFSAALVNHNIAQRTLKIKPHPSASNCFIQGRKGHQNVQPDDAKVITVTLPGSDVTILACSR